MATSARTVKQGESINLFIEVRNFDGVLVDSSTTPVVSIFDFDSDPRNSATVDADAIVLDSTTVTSVANGIYQYTYTVSVDAHVGTWFDRWVITIDGISSTAILQFDVTASAGNTAASTNEGTVVLMPNNAIVITITDDIQAEDGSALTDGFQYYFTTPYTPLHSTVKKVRLKAGAYMTSIPDDTISLAIFEGSLEADAITFGMAHPPRTAVTYVVDTRTIVGTNVRYTGLWPVTTSRSGGSYFRLALEKYTTCMAVWFILSNSLGPTAKKKRLADFSVDYGDGSLKDFMGSLRDECSEWESVLQSGGHITKGASLPPGIGLKGVSHGDHPPIGRTIDPGNRRPASNTKLQRIVHGSWYHTYRNR